jgi:hypothetical protein
MLTSRSTLLSKHKLHSLAVFLLLSGMTIQATAQPAGCEPSGGYGFVCGPANAEDLVLIPGTDWIIASGMAPGASMQMINVKSKTAIPLYPGDSPRANQDSDRYGGCPGPPDAVALITHGLNLRPGAGRQATLYAVSHGAREAIEVFHVDAGGERPALTWIGCVLMPAGLAANSVASFSDGSLVATVLVRPGKTFRDAFALEPTGAVYAWSPGDSGFALLEGTELPANNGIEVAADEREIYVVSTTLRMVVAFSRSNPARRLRWSRQLPFGPDNIHMGKNGRLITAGMVSVDDVCGSPPTADDFEGKDPEAVFAGYIACHRGVIVAEIDPRELQDTELIHGPADRNFSNATMALQVGKEVWIGTFAGDRIAYLTLKP